MVNPVKQPPKGWIWFNTWVRTIAEPLVVPYTVWTGDDIIVSSKSGAKFLTKAYRYVICNFEKGFTYHGKFNASHFLVSNDGQLCFDITLRAERSTGTGDLFQDLDALNNALLHHFMLDSREALYISHLRYFTTHPPASIWDCQRCWERYLDFLKYQFVFADPNACAALSDALWNAATQMGSQDWYAFNQIISDVWNSLPIPPNKRNWVKHAHGNPIYHEMLEFDTSYSKTQWRNLPRALYRFCRNTDVHGPHKTLVELLLPRNEGAAQEGHEKDLQGYVDMQDTIGQKAWDALRQEAAVRKQEREAAGGQQGQEAAGGQQGQEAAGGQQGQEAAGGDQGQEAAGGPKKVNVQTMKSPTELNLMLAFDFGRFIAQATVMIVIELDLGSFCAYIDEPYNLYKKTIDAVHDSCVS